MTKSLLEQAKEQNKPTPPTKEELEVVVAYVNDEIPATLASQVLKCPYSSVYHRASRILQDGVKSGLVEVRMKG